MVDYGGIIAIKNAKTFLAMGQSGKRVSTIFGLVVINVTLVLLYVNLST